MAGSRTRLSADQIVGFWAAWAGWTLDGMDSFIYALVMAPALTELLPKSGITATPANVTATGPILFALFLVGWGLSFLWGPVADRFGRTRTLAATIFIYAIFTGAAALSNSVWELGLFRLLAGIGIGAFCGAIIGLITTVARVPSLVVTLATLYIIRGLDVLIVGGSQVVPPGYLGIESFYLDHSVPVWIFAFGGRRIDQVGPHRHALQRFDPQRNQPRR